MFTAQQRSMILHPDAPQVDINADAGVIQARRIIDRLYADEQASRVATTRSPSRPVPALALLSGAARSCPRGKPERLA